MVGDVAHVLEVRRQQGLLQRVLGRRAALVEREVEQPVRVDGVRVERLAEAQVESDLTCELRDMLLHLGDPRPAAVPLCQRGRHRLGPSDGRRGIELEGAVDHVDRMWERRDRLLEAALADEAPGTHDV